MWRPEHNPVLVWNVIPGGRGICMGTIPRVNGIKDLLACRPGSCVDGDLRDSVLHGPGATKCVADRSEHVGKRTQSLRRVSSSFEGLSVCIDRVFSHQLLRAQGVGGRCQPAGGRSRSRRPQAAPPGRSRGTGQFCRWSEGVAGARPVRTARSGCSADPCIQAPRQFVFGSPRGLFGSVEDCPRTWAYAPSSIRLKLAFAND